MIINKLKLNYIFKIKSYEQVATQTRLNKSSHPHRSWVLRELKKQLLHFRTKIQGICSQQTHYFIFCVCTFCHLVIYNMQVLALTVKNLKFMLLLQCPGISSCFHSRYTSALMIISGGQQIHNSSNFLQEKSALCLIWAARGALCLQL